MSEEKSVRLVSGGDVEFAIRPKDLPSVSAPEVQAALDYLKQGDLCFMNCEMGLSCGGYRIPKVFNIRSDPSFVEDLVSMGIQGVSLANNHVMDFGHEALFETLATIDAAGIPRERREPSEPV